MAYAVKGNTICKQVCSDAIKRFSACLVVLPRLKAESNRLIRRYETAHISILNLRRRISWPPETSPSAAAATQRNIEIDEVRIPEPLWSVGSRVSWGALVAGGVVALAIYILLSLLGVALGVTVSDRFSP